MTYSIFDPTGNITALIEGSCSSEEAADLMRDHPEVEQAGFIREAIRAEEGVDAVLEMAGGEFCGNASMCAAAWTAMRNDGCNTVRLRVSGTNEPVDVMLEAAGAGIYDAEVCMPRAIGIKETELSFEGITGYLPLVSWEGLSHLVIEKGSVFFYLLNDREKAEDAVRNWCSILQTKGLGLMFVEGSLRHRKMNPLVYVPGSDTLFWEHSCASGSSAVCLYLSEKDDGKIELELEQPGGILKVACSADHPQIRLRGKVKLISRN